MTVRRGIKGRCLEAGISDVTHRNARIVRPVIGCAAALALTVCGGGGSGSSPITIVAATGTAPVATATPTPTPYSTPVAALTGVVVQARDSIGVGETASYAAIDRLGLGSGVRIINDSVSGRTMATGYALRAAELFPYLDGSRASVLLIEQGTNDLGAVGTTAPDLYRLLTLFVSDAHAAGFDVVMETLLPRADAGWSAQEAQRIV